MQKKSSILFALLIVASMVLAACPAPTAAPAGESGSMADDGEMMDSALSTLNYNLATEPPTLDPALSTDTTSSALIKSLFVGLVKPDVETQEPMPSLATEWSGNEDNTVFTYSIRNDIPWVMYDGSDVVQATGEGGEPLMVTAQDVVYGVQRTCDAETASDYAYILYIIAGCEAANSGEGSVDDVGVVALDESTVEFTLVYGASFFPQITAMPQTFPQPQAAIEAGGETWTEPETMVSSGPFALTEWAHGDSMQLVRNPFWFGWEEDDRVGNVGTINFVMIEEVSTAFALYEDGELDTSGVPQAQMENVFYTEGSELEAEGSISPRNCVYYYGFITEKEAVSDVRVRRALSMAVDRETLIEAVIQGGQTPANTVTGELNFGSFAQDPAIAPWALSEELGGTGYEGAVAMAQELMTEAGYENGAGLSLTIGHNVSEGHSQIAQAIQAMWSEAFPEIEVLIETQEWAVYLDAIENEAPLEAKPDVYRLGWCMDYTHANNILHEVFNPEQGSNRIMVSADSAGVGDLVGEYMELTSSAQVATEDESLELYQRAEQLLVDEFAGVIPIYYYTQVWVTKPYLDRTYSEDPYFEFWSIDESAK